MPTTAANRFGSLLLVFAGIVHFVAAGIFHKQSLLELLLETTLVIDVTWSSIILTARADYRRPQFLLRIRCCVSSSKLISFFFIALSLHCRLLLIHNRIMIIPQHESTTTMIYKPSSPESDDSSISSTVPVLSSDACSPLDSHQCESAKQSPPSSTSKKSICNL